MNIFMEINKSFWNFSNDFVINSWLQTYVWFFADIPIFFLPIFLLYYWFFYTYKEKNNNQKSNLLKIFYSTIFAISISLIIQQFFHIERPESLVTPIIQHIPDASFPSDHASVSFAFLFSLFFAKYKKTFFVFTPFVIIMNLSRISWWIHWLFDVLVWMLIGLFSAILVFKVLWNNKYMKNFNEWIIKTMNFIKM